MCVAGFVINKIALYCKMYNITFKIPNRLVVRVRDRERKNKNGKKRAQNKNETPHKTSTVTINELPFNNFYFSSSYPTAVCVCV